MAGVLVLAQLCRSNLELVFPFSMSCVVARYLHNHFADTLIELSFRNPESLELIDYDIQWDLFVELETVYHNYQSSLQNLRNNSNTTMEKDEEKDKQAENGEPEKMTIVEMLKLSRDDSVTDRPEDDGNAQPMDFVTGQPVRSASAPSRLIRLQSVKDESSGAVDFVKNVLTICCCSAGIFIVFGLMVVIPIAKLTIGSIYLYDCPAQRFIPIFLIVGGCTALVSSIIRFTLWCMRYLGDGPDEDNKPSVRGSIFYTIFAVTWLIAGSVWIYGTYGRFTTDDPTADYFCHPTLYWFAFAIITFGWSVFGVAILGVLLCLVVGGILSR